MSRILVAEDDNHIQRLLRHVITREGHEVEIVSDGLEVVPTLERDGADLLLLDLGLPGIDGLQVLRRVRTHAEWSGLPVLMLTASGRERDEEAAWRAGVDAFLPKPFSTQDLRLRMSELLARRAG